MAYPPLAAKIRDKQTKPKRKIIQTRDKRPSKKASVGRFLLQIPWSTLFSSCQSSKKKLQILIEIVNYGLNTIIFDHTQLNRTLRNKVKRERKRCCKVYYENRVKDLHDSKSHDWWRDVKQLCGNAKSTKKDIKSRLCPDLTCEETLLAENINEPFINIIKDY